ncbi:MAG: mercury methylation ferredoxin HgcB [Planctomycetota bacterium]|jgi:NAD-dependent dihydropyrimidine dehydrogenase PreA subunit
MAELRYLPDVVSLALDDEKCTGCGMCQTVCPHAVFQTENGNARIADRDACMECGACALNCPAGALSVQSGVGCAAAVINSVLRGAESCCDCSDDSPCCG